MTFLIVAMGQICIATNGPMLYQYRGNFGPTNSIKIAHLEFVKKIFFLSRYSMYLNLSHGTHFVHMWLLYRIQKIEKLKKWAKVTPVYGNNPMRWRQDRAKASTLSHSKRYERPLYIITQWDETRIVPPYHTQRHETPVLINH